MTSSRWGLLLVLAGSVLGGASCATEGPSATELLENRRLLNRAAFDLACTEALTVVRIDATTRGVSGCGQRVTYVQICDASWDNVMRQCSWLANTATPAASEPQISRAPITSP